MYSVEFDLLILLLSLFVSRLPSRLGPLYHSTVIARAVYLNEGDQPNVLKPNLDNEQPHSQVLEKSEGVPVVHSMREVSLVTCILSVTLTMH